MRPVNEAFTPPYTPQVGDEVLMKRNFGMDRGIVFNPNCPGAGRKAGKLGVTSGSSNWLPMYACKDLYKIGFCEEMTKNTDDISQAYKIADAYYAKFDSPPPTPAAPKPVEFKVGDKVEFVAVSFGAPEDLIGQQGIIKAFTKSGNPQVSVNSTSQWCVQTKDLRLVE